MPPALRPILCGIRRQQSNGLTTLGRKLGECCGSARGFILGARPPGKLYGMPPAPAPVQGRAGSRVVGMIRTTARA